jgi:hypothetical protein
VVSQTCVEFDSDLQVGSLSEMTLTPSFSARDLGKLMFILFGSQLTTISRRRSSMGGWRGSGNTKKIRCQMSILEIVKL